MKDNALKQYLTVYAQCDLLNVRLDWDEKLKLFYYLTYFCYYLRVSLHFLVLFMDPTVLFQRTFNFIYSTFSNKFSVSAK